MKIKYIPKSIINLGFDLETTGVPQHNSFFYEKGNIKGYEKKIYVDDKIFEYSESFNKGDFISFKKDNKAYTIEKQENVKNFTEITLPEITSIGYILRELKTPFYEYDEETKILKVNFLENEQIFNCENINIDKNVILNFLSDGKLFILKKGLLFERKIKSGKEVDVPCFDYIGNSSIVESDLKFFEISPNTEFSPEASALTKIYSSNNFKNFFTSNEQLELWINKFLFKFKNMNKDDTLTFSINKNSNINTNVEELIKFLDKLEFRDLSEDNLEKYGKGQDYKKIKDRILNSDIIWGHNVIGFDTFLISHYDTDIADEIDNKIFFDTMTMPLKIDGAREVKRLNVALNAILKKKKDSKDNDENLTKDLSDLIDEREKYHDALLDIKGNAILFDHQLLKVLNHPDSDKILKNIQEPYIKLNIDYNKSEVNLDTIIGLTTDNQSLSNIKEISKISKDFGYKNIAISNKFQNDFPINDKILKSEDLKSIRTLYIKIEGHDVIVVLKNPHDLEVLEALIEKEMELNYEQFVAILKDTENTINFLIKPDFDYSFKIKNDKIFVRVDPFLDFDYSKEFKNKRILTVSPIVEKNDLSNFTSSVIFQSVKENKIFDGNVDILNIMKFNRKKYIFGIPSKVELENIFPSSKFKDIYENANKIGKESITFDLYSGIHREEFLDFKELYGVKLVEKDDIELNRLLNEELSIKGNVEKEEKELLIEKYQYLLYLKDLVYKKFESNETKALLYFYVLKEKEILIDGQLGNLQEMSIEEKTNAILNYVNNLDNLTIKEEIEKHFKEYKNQYKDRIEKEISVLNNLKAGTKLSIFYFKYLLNQYFINKEIYAKNGIIIGAGRGSVGGSMLSFFLEISQLDPIRHNAIFERFTNIDKTAKPDIDIDHNDKNKALNSINEYIHKNYNFVSKLNISNEIKKVINPNKPMTQNILNKVNFSAKTFFEGLSKSLRMRALDVAKLKNNFYSDDSDEGKPIFYKNILAISDEKTKSYYSKVPFTTLKTFDELLKYKKEEIYKNTGYHASGVIIQPTVIYSDMKAVTPYCEEGHLPEKNDILGLETLEIMKQYEIYASLVKIRDLYPEFNINDYQIEEIILNFNDKKTFYENFLEYFNIQDEAELKKNIYKINNSFKPDYLFNDFMDEKVLELLDKQHTGGIFQMQGGVQNKLLKSLISLLKIVKKEKFEKYKNTNIHTILTIINAVNRPGPLSAKMDEELITNFKNDTILLLEKNNLLEHYEDNPILKRDIKNFKNNKKVMNFYETESFKRRLLAEIISERRNIEKGKESVSLIGVLINQGLEDEDIVEEFKKYEENMKNQEKINKVLSNSFNSILYQEQIMQLSIELAGFTPSESDELRSAVAKKKADKLKIYIGKFIEGCIKNKTLSENEAIYLGEKFIGFGSYCFNLAHAGAYSLISYQTAMQKAYNPQIFYCVNFNLSKQESIAPMIKELEDSNLKIKTSLTNESYQTFIFKDKEILIPLTAYKGTKENAIKSIVKNIKEGEKFENFYDLYTRTYPELDKKTVEVLAKTGVLKDILNKEGLTCKYMVENLTEIFKVIKEKYEKSNKNIMKIEKLNKSLNLKYEKLQEIEDKTLISSLTDNLSLEINKLNSDIEKLTNDLEKTKKKLEEEQKNLTGLFEPVNNGVYIKNLINNIPNLIEEYPQEDFLIYQYSLLKNLAPEKIFVKADNLTEFMDSNINTILQANKEQYKKGDFIYNISDKFEEIFGITPHLEPIFVGSNPKIIMFSEFSDEYRNNIFGDNPNYFDFVEELEIDGTIFERTSPERPFFKEKDKNRGKTGYLKNNPETNTKDFIDNSDRKNPKVFISENYQILKGKNSTKEKFLEELNRNGLNLDNLIVLPAYPYTNEEMKNGIDKFNVLFKERVFGIISSINPKLVIFTNTMREESIKKLTLGGKETEIDIGSTYVFENGTIACQIPKLNNLYGESIKKLKDTLFELLNETETESKEIEEYSIDFEEKNENLKKNSNKI